MDYPTLLRRLDGLGPDTPCCCEHLHGEDQHIDNVRRIRRHAEAAGVRFLRRGE
jgi:hypothetical protein